MLLGILEIMYLWSLVKWPKSHKVTLVTWPKTYKATFEKAHIFLWYGLYYICSQFLDIQLCEFLELGLGVGYRVALQCLKTSLMIASTSFDAKMHFIYPVVFHRFLNMAKYSWIITQIFFLRNVTLWDFGRRKPCMSSEWVGPLFARLYACNSLVQS